MKESYAFWNFIVEESYLPQNPHLRTASWKQFCHQEQNKDIYLFGCNAASSSFILQYQNQFKIVGILDNDSMKWNTQFEGRRVLNPREIVPRLLVKDAAIVIAMRRNADAAAQQLEKFGFDNYYGLGVLVSQMSPYLDLVERIEDWKEHYPLEDIIMLESTNDFDGNSGALYEYLKSIGSRHHFVWVVKKEESKKFLLNTRDKALCPESSIEDLKQYLYYRSVSKWQIWDNLPIPKVRPDQVNVFLQHFGMGYKKIGSVYRAPDYVDYVLTTNEIVYELEKDSLLYGPDTKVIFGELPRNDVLFSNRWNELEKLISKRYDKVVMWAPTLRKSGLNHRTDSDKDYPFGISVIYTEEEMGRLNQFLRNKNMLMLLKLHPKQVLNYMDIKYSNILYLDGVTVKKVHAYKLLTQVDAMISDYSSIVFDYMILDRPIAWAVDDMECYQIPFLMDDPFTLMPGEKLYCFEDIVRFLTHVSVGVDEFRQERACVAYKYNAPMEGRGCENLVRILGLEV